MESNVAAAPEAVTEATASANSTYSVVFVNDSTQFGVGCIYQRTQNLGGVQIFPLAWLCQPAAPQLQVNFRWNTNYTFFWSSTGSLTPGININPAQTAPADPNGQNRITLEGGNGNTHFSSPTSGAQPGDLNIIVSGGIPMNQLSVGIGMEYAPAYAAQALPNMNYNFPAAPQYFITFGANFSPGQVLNPSSLQNSLMLPLSPNFNSVKAVLNQNMMWTIQPV